MQRFIFNVTNRFDFLLYFIQSSTIDGLSSFIYSESNHEYNTFNIHYKYKITHN